MFVGSWKSPANGCIDFPQETYVTTLSSQQPKTQLYRSDDHVRDALLRAVQ